MKRHLDTIKEITITKKVRFRAYNENRCSIDCDHIYKDDGNYHCALFNECVDFGGGDFGGGGASGDW